MTMHRNPALNGMGLIVFQPQRDEGVLAEVKCHCGAIGLIDKRWLMYTSRFYRIGARMYFELPNRWCIQTIPKTDPENYVCPHCMFTRTYEVLSSVRHSLEKHGEFNDIMREEHERSKARSEAADGCKREGQGTSEGNGTDGEGTPMPG